MKGNQLFRCKKITAVCRKYFFKTPTRTKSDFHRLSARHSLHRYSLLQQWFVLVPVSKWLPEEPVGGAHEQGLKLWMLNWGEIPYLIFLLFLIRVWWYWATVQLYPFIDLSFAAWLTLDPHNSCKMSLLSKLYCALISAFYITLTYGIRVCALRHRRPSKPIPFGYRD